MIRLRNLLTEDAYNYASFERVLKSMGYQDDDSVYESRFKKPLAAGVLCFDVEERFAGDRRTNQFEFTFYFQPYVHEKTRMLGLYKRRYHAPAVNLNHDTIDFGEGLFRADSADVENKLRKLLETGERRIESLQIEDIAYSKMSKVFQPSADIIKQI